MSSQASACSGGAAVTGNRTLPRLLIALLLAMLVIVGVMGQAVRVLKADDDNLWLSFAVDKVFAHQKALDIENDVIEAAKKDGAPADRIYRLEMRRDYDVNYRAVITAWALLDRLLLEKVTEPVQRMALRLTTALWPLVALPWLAFAWLLTCRSCREVQIGALGVLAWFALVSMIDGARGSFIPFGKSISPKTLTDIVTFAINPVSFSIFGFTPRNMLTVLVAATMLARWSGMNRTGYVLLLLGTVVHTSLGLLVLALFVVADLLLHRTRLRDPIVLCVVGLALIYGLASERMLSIALSPIFAMVGAMTVFLLVPVAVWWVFAREPERRLPVLQPLMQWLSARSDRTHSLVRADVEFVAAVLVLALIIGAIVSQFAPARAVMYFWGQLPTRIYGAIGPGALIGAVALLLVGRRRETVKTVVLTLTVITTVVGVLFIGRQQPHAKVLARQLTAHEQTLAGGRHKRWNDESLIYYEQGRAFMTGTTASSRLRVGKDQEE